MNNTALGYILLTLSIVFGCFLSIALYSVGSILFFIFTENTEGAVGYLIGQLGGYILISIITALITIKAWKKGRSLTNNS